MIYYDMMVGKARLPIARGLDGPRQMWSIGGDATPRDRMRYPEQHGKVSPTMTRCQLTPVVLFLATSVFLAVILRFSQAAYLGRFYLAYLVIHLFPFLIVNGILTGTFLETPVVWYDDTQNLGIRILTIPLDDFVYGFLLYLSNVTLYEWFIRRRESTQNGNGI